MNISQLPPPLPSMTPTPAPPLGVPPLQSPVQSLFLDTMICPPSSSETLPLCHHPPAIISKEITSLYVKISKGVHMIFDCFIVPYTLIKTRDIVLGPFLLKY